MRRLKSGRRRKPSLSIAVLALATFAYAEEIDAEIIRHLDFFQNMELLENMDTLGETLESADDAELEGTASDDPTPADKNSEKKKDKEAV